MILEEGIYSGTPLRFIKKLQIILCFQDCYIYLPMF